MDLAERTRAEDFAVGTRFDTHFLGRQRYRLMVMRTTLLRELDGAEGGPGAVDDRGDPVLSELAREFETVLHGRLRRRLRHVERALEKIAEGTYGLCDATGEFISGDRLDLVPETIFATGVRRMAGIL